MVGRGFTHKEVNITCTCILIMHVQVYVPCPPDYVWEKFARNSPRDLNLTSLSSTIPLLTSISLKWWTRFLSAHFQAMSWATGCTKGASDQECWWSVCSGRTWNYIHQNSVPQSAGWSSTPFKYANTYHWSLISVTPAVHFIVYNVFNTN